MLANILKVVKWSVGKRPSGIPPRTIRTPCNSSSSISIADTRNRGMLSLNRLDQGLVDRSAGVTITTRHREPWITVPRLEALPEPVNLDTKGRGDPPLGHPRSARRRKRDRTRSFVEKACPCAGRLSARSYRTRQLSAVA